MVKITLGSGTDGRTGSGCCYMKFMVIRSRFSKFLLLVLSAAATCLSLNKANAADIIGTNANPNGPGSLFAALDMPNQTATPHRIVYNVPGNGAWSIPTATLWGITSVAIDERTQAGVDGISNCLDVAVASR